MENRHTMDKGIIKATQMTAKTPALQNIISHILPNFVLCSQMYPIECVTACRVKILAAHRWNRFRVE